MYDFWIGTTATHTGLDGTSQLDPIKGIIFLPSPELRMPAGAAGRGVGGDELRVPGGAGETTEDLLTIALEDRNLDLSGSSPPTIASVMSIFEHYFDLARLFVGSGLGSPVLLHAEPVAGEEWESLVVDGWTESAAKGSETEARLAGNLVLTLHVRRQNFWQQPEVQLNTTSPLGDDAYAGSVLFLMSFLSVANAMLIAPASPDVGPELRVPAGADLPSPLRLEIENLDAAPIGTLLISQNVNSEPESRFYVLDDFTGVSGASTPVEDADSLCNGYQDCTFTDMTATALMTWELADDFCQDCKGNFFRFILRLGADLAYTDLELKVQLKLHVTSSVVGDSGWTLAVPANRLQVLGTMRLPPFLLSDFANSAGLDLVLWARRSTTGSHSLAVDYLQLMPLDGWRRYDALYPLPQNWKLIDDGPRNLVTSLDVAGSELITHVAMGRSFNLAPHVPNAFFFAWMDDAGAAPIAAQIKVKAFTRFRRRLL